MQLKTVQELENAKENNSFNNITISAQTTVKDSAGFLNLVTLNTSPTSAIRFYDNTVSGGTVIATIPGSATAGNSYPFQVHFSTGLTVSSGSANTDITISFR